MRSMVFLIPGLSVQGALGHDDEERARTLVGVMDGYFSQGAHHLNVNVFGVDKLKDAMEHPRRKNTELHNPCQWICS